MRSLCSPFCAVLCFAVLVRSRFAVRVVRAVAGAWCCGALLCVVLFPVVCRGAVLGLVARGCLLVACFGVGVPVWPQNLRILMKQERTKDWVRLVPWALLTMNSQRSSSTGFTPHELFHGERPAWFFKTAFPEDFKSPVGDWLEHKQSRPNQAETNLRHIRDRELSRRNRLRRPASFKVGGLVLVHHSRLPSWPRNCLQDPYFGPYRIIRIDGSRIHVRCSPRLGGELLCAPKQLRHYHTPDDLSSDEWRLSDSKVERIDLENAASPEEADEL